MKRFILSLSLLVSISLYSQNPFVDGIQSAGRIDFKGDYSESVLNNFKVDFPDVSSAVYTYSYKWKEDNEENLYFFEIKWNWSDISVIKIDKELFVVELITEYRVMESTTYRSTQEKIVDDKALNADIYFRDLDDANAAANWVLTKVRQCGGNAKLLN